MIILKSNTSSNDSLLEKVIGRLKKPFYKKVYGLTNSFTQLDKRCLLYMKTSPLYRKSNQHTNMWETRQWVYILNSLGFLVDMVSPELNDYVPVDEYDLFIGYGSGNSGKHFYKYAKALTKAKKIIYATGPEPSLSNRLVRERYDNFNERTGLAAPYMRTIDVDFEEFSAVGDYIFCIGEKGGFSYNSYAKHGLPVFPIIPSQNAAPPTQTGNKKDLRQFLCFAGNGLICKGADILIEAFKGLPDFVLHICGPKEDAFYDAYSELFKSSSNIQYYGFVDIEGNTYRDLCEKCSFTLLHSAAEGCCTAIVNNMVSGLIPVINYEVGIDVGDFGYQISSSADKVGAVRDAVLEVSSMDKNEYDDRVAMTINASTKYNQQAFIESAHAAIEQVIAF